MLNDDKYLFPSDGEKEKFTKVLTGFLSDVISNGEVENNDRAYSNPTENDR